MRKRAEAQEKAREVVKNKEELVNIVTLADQYCVSMQVDAKQRPFPVLKPTTLNLGQIHFHLPFFYMLQMLTFKVGVDN